MFDVWRSRAHCSGMPCVGVREAPESVEVIFRHKRQVQSEKERITKCSDILAVQTYGKLPSDGVKPNMNGVFKI